MMVKYLRGAICTPQIFNHLKVGQSLDKAGLKLYTCCDTSLHY